MKETENILSFKIGNTIQHPENGGFVTVNTSHGDRDFPFPCTMAPNDSFKVLDTPWKFRLDIKYNIHLEKTGGTPGDQEICPKGSFVTTKAFCNIETNDVGIPDYICMASSDFLSETAE